MSDENKARLAHDVLDGLSAGRILSRENEQLLRSFLPELSKQMTLEEITEHVRYAWIGTSDNVWAGNSYNREITLESWMGELYVQLQGLADAEPAKPAHPEFLETKADYENAPEGTIVACEDSPPWHKFDSAWLSTAAYEGNNAKNMTGIIRRVLRWGDGE